MHHNPYFWSVCVLSLFLFLFLFFLCFFVYRQYLESRSLNHRVNSWEGHNLDMACEEECREGTCKDRDQDWHHYSKSSGRSGRSGRSRRSSRRHRDRKRRPSHSRHRSSSVWELFWSLYLSSVYATRSNGSLSPVFSQCLTPMSLSLSVCATRHY